MRRIIAGAAAVNRSVAGREVCGCDKGGLDYFVAYGMDLLRDFRLQSRGSLICRWYNEVLR